MNLSVFAIVNNYVDVSAKWKNAAYVVCAGCIGVSQLAAERFPYLT